MRMRKKNRLDERLYVCRDYLICKLFHQCAAPERAFAEVVDVRLPTWLEIGCGKGGFINRMARTHGGVNFIAVEKNENVAVSAMERSYGEEIPNVRYIIGLAEYLERFVPSASIERIYLNFSCPFPKDRHAKRRLTHPNYLEIYSRILKAGGEIRFKTDDVNFFEFTIDSLSRAADEKGAKFLLKNCTTDLHNSGVTDNIVTEYEDYFIRNGYKINYLEAILK
ncbi:MAG: tRNA (guanosine(46)-N7)-methyltransferase TrmB [Oscillospiraceae bacterium]|nr:tRNA (guanosine(46)-N7)-methyltransferase TrmB [Oscillospiraceae bacterium]